MDEDEMAELWRRMVRVLCRNGMAEAAEDLAQEALAQLWRYGDGVQHRRAYAWQVMRNEARRLRRRWQRQRGRERPLDEVEEAAAGEERGRDGWRCTHPALWWEDVVEEELISREEAMAIAALLGGMGRRERLLGWLYWVVGAGGVAARVLGLSSECVRVRALRLRRRILTAALAGEGLP